MKNNNLYHFILSSIFTDIKYYERMIKLNNNPFQKMLYESLLYNERRRLNYWENYHYDQLNTQENQDVNFNQKVFTIEELSLYNGSNEKPAYVAVNGIVYDVSLEATWGGGTHFNNYAGKDLTNQFMGCHSGRLEILKGLPQVGILQE